MVGQFSRRLFAFLTLSLLSFTTFFSRRPSPVHYLKPYARAVGDHDPHPPSPRSNHTVAIAGLAALPSSSSLSLPSSSSFSSSSTRLSSTSITSTSTTSISTRTSSTPRPLPTLPIPTTTTLTSSTVSILASSLTTPYFLMSDVTPSTTFYIAAADSSASTTVVSSVGPSSTGTLSSNRTSSSQFWDNKGAVAATFLFTSLLALAFAIMIITMILKRQKARREAITDAEFMPNYQEPKSHGPSPTPSISSSPLDPFKSREVVHVHLPTGISASSKPLNSHGQHIPTIHLTPPSALPSRYLSPSQIQPASTTTNAAGQRNKSEMRVSMQSGYQPSFDSFYGAYE